MDSWEESDNETKFGVAIQNFYAPGDHQLELRVGDTVHVLSVTRDWYYGYNTKNRHERGIFPQSFIQLKDGAVCKSGTTYESRELPIVQEITSVLREWGNIWKDLYLDTKNRELAEFDNIYEMMIQLIDWRRLIMARKLTLDEMKVLQQKVTNKIDMGNARLGLDLVVRDEEGNILDPTDTSIISLYRQHRLTTQRVLDEKDSPSDKALPGKTSFNVLVCVKNFVCRVGDDSDVLMTLYDAKEGQFLSESYLMKWGNKGMPKDMELLHNLRVLYTDLGARDVTREKVFLVCQVIRIGRMDLKGADNKKQARVKRPFGVAAIDITETLRGSVKTDDEKQIFIPFVQCGERDFMEAIIRKATSAKEVNHKGQGLYVTMQKLHGDLKQVQKEYPHLINTTTCVSRKIGFPDVIMQDDVRNDLYVTILQGEFKRGSKTADKNVEVTMCVCNQHGQVLENVISEGVGGRQVSCYSSVVYYHEDKPKWFETVKVAISVDEFYGSHIKFAFKHKSSNDAKARMEKPFAMAYIKLMKENGTTLSDSVHNLLVYKMDMKKHENPGVYLKLPSTYKELERVSHPGLPLKQFPIQSQDGSLILNSYDSFVIKTEVCTTKLTHNVELMGLLKWRDNPAGLRHHLVQFMHVDGEEVVKFLQDTLDALFNILMQNSDSDEYDHLVFEALIFLVGLVSNRKCHQFRPKLDAYIRENFSATLAYNKLMVVLTDTIKSAKDPSKHDAAIKTFHSFEYIFKFIIRSRILFSALNEGRGKQQFELSLHQVMESLGSLIQERGDKATLMTVQGSIFKYLPTTIPDIMTVLDLQEFSRDLVQLVKCVPKGKFLRQKLQFIKDVVHSPLFISPESRRILLPEFLGLLTPMLDNHIETELCVVTLSDILDLLHRGDMVTTSEDINTISKSCLRKVMQTVIKIDRSTALAGNCVAVMTAILHQMLEPHYNEYIRLFDTTIDLLDFLMEILLVFQDLVSRNVYPVDWCDMIMLQNSVFLKSLRYFSTTIRERFNQPFEYQVWNNFFHCAITFLTQTPLQLETFSSLKRNKIIARYRDMRREAGLEVRSMWFNLGHHKFEFIPSLVGPVLEMTLLPEMELRKRTIPIFFDMMQCEFMSSIGNRGTMRKKNFQNFERELISRLDALVEGGRGDMQYKQLFYTIMKQMFDAHPTMRDQGLVFVDMIKDLLQRLLEYRAVIKDENREHRMNCTVNLLNFYHDINRREMYIRYLHKLCQLHLDCDNYTEAAYTLLLYVSMLKWADDNLQVILMSKKYPDEETHRSLKERLYYDIIDYFDKGKMWETGIELCKELAEQYERETFEYTKLSQILQKQADFYDRIMTQIRPEPYYFRVGYYGLGFPSFLQNKVFVYRGKEYERLSDFTARLSNQFPNAQLMKTLSPPSDDIRDSPNQYLQINAINPLMELKSHLANKKVDEQILKYYRVNEVQKFTYSRKKDESTNDVTKLCLEKTNVVISYPLPGILRWFPVVSTHMCEVSALENAIETLEKTNQKIQSLIEQHRMDPSLRIDPLGMVLNGVADAAVNGGIANYKLFYSEEYLKQDPSPQHADNVTKLRELTTIQLLLLMKGLELHGSRAPENLQPFQAHMEQRFSQMRQFVEEEYNIKIEDKDKTKLKLFLTPSPLPVKRLQSVVNRHSEPVQAVLTPKGWSKTTAPYHSTMRRLSKSSAASSEVRPSGQTDPGQSPTRSQSTFYTTTPPPDNPSKRFSQASLASNDNVEFRSKNSDRSSKNEMGLKEKSEKFLNRLSKGSTGSLDLLSKESTPTKTDRQSAVIELNQELTARRPRRPEPSSRPSSTVSSVTKQQSPTPSDSASTDPSPLQPLSATDTSQLSEQLTFPNSSSNGMSDAPPTSVPSEEREDDTPPPLPLKQQHSDYANINIGMGADGVTPVSISPRHTVTHREKPQLPVPVDGTAPVIPPKNPASRATQLGSIRSPPPVPPPKSSPTTPP